MACRLELKKKDLVTQKEELLKESKNKQATFDNVKTQVDKLMKVSARNTRIKLHVLIQKCHVDGSGDQKDC